MEYEERGRVMLLELDFRDPVLYLDSALVTGWQAPADQEAVTPADKVRILTNVYDYLVRQRGFDKVELDPS
ncbi:hypothetical protein JZU71_02610 [bacterium]|nr:hypothetical protein [bacterium]